MAFRQFQKNPKPGNLASLQCNYLDMGVGLDLCGIGFPRWRSSLHFSVMPDTKQLVMTIQGSSPVAATTMTTPNTPFLLRSLYLFFFYAGLLTAQLSVTYSFWRLSLHWSSQLPLLQVSCSFLFFSFTLRTFLILYFVSFFYGLSISTTPNHPWKISAIWCEVLVVFIDCTGPSDLYGISVIFTDQTEKWSSLFLSFSLCLFVCVLFMCSTHSLLYIAGSSSLHCPGGFGFSFRG